jgi:hypothetical protein
MTYSTAKPHSLPELLHQPALEFDQVLQTMRSIAAQLVAFDWPAAPL